MLDLVLSNIEESVKDTKIRGNLGFSDYALFEFMRLMNIGLAKNGVRTLNFRLFKELLNEISQKEGVKKRLEQSRLLLKCALLRAQEFPVSTCRKSSRRGRKQAWFGKDLLVKLREKKSKYKQWKEGCITWEEYGDAVWICRDGVRKAKTQFN